MNTVDALKKLYKTLAGKDYAGDPNPTDAEMINAIAKDAQSSGSGGGSGSARIIDLMTLDHREEVDPENDKYIMHCFSGYEAGLSVSDFLNTWCTTHDPVMLVPVLQIMEIPDKVQLIFAETTEPSLVLYYIPETGEFYFYADQQGGIDGQ